MPAPRTFAHNTPLLVVRRHLTHTHRELRAQPVANAYVPTFVGLLATWGTTFQTDFDLEDQVDAAASDERAIDGELNRVAAHALQGDRPARRGQQARRRALALLRGRLRPYLHQAYFIGAIGRHAHVGRFARKE
jgi:hypothetical protein